jgi:basic membrane protein A
MKRFTVLVVLLLVGVLAVSAAPKFKIGMVFDIAGRGDNSFNDSAYNGLVNLAKAYKGWIDGDPSKVNFGSEIQIKYAEPKGGGQDRETLMRALAEDGYNPIYGIGFAFGDSIAKVAKDFPDTHIIGIDVFLPDLTSDSNITCVGFKENEGSFLMGALAAYKANGKKIGFIGGVDIGLIHRFENGYRAGAMYVNPAYRKDGSILVQYISKEFSGFNDPKGGYDVAMNLYKQGAVIVYHAAGGSGDGLFKAAMETKKIGIGVDSDQALVYAGDTDPAVQGRAKYVMTSMLKRVDNAVFAEAKEFMTKGSLEGGYKSFNLASDGIGYAVNKLNKADLDPYNARMQALRAKIISGAITVPDENVDVAAWAKTLK